MRKLFGRVLTAPITLALMPVPAARRAIQRHVPVSKLNFNTSKQLLVDVSVLVREDARTGIQRVVRALLLQLIMNPPVGYQVKPVFATRKHGYRYAPIDSSHLQCTELERNSAASVKTVIGDIFLGLDLAAHLLPHHTGELVRWKRKGVKLAFLVYDILPVLHPHWFNPKRYKTFVNWLRTLAIFADDLICISNSSKLEITNYLDKQYGLNPTSISFHTIPLGANIKASMPSRGLQANMKQLLATMAGKPSFLMVGTLEPRKGHIDVIAAFDHLWQCGKDINLVIVGKPGWKTEALQLSLRSHPQNQTHLFWLDNASDETLELLYKSITGVIIASQAEGFGLPLIEALHYGKPVLASDIPVFHEHANDLVTFFHNFERNSLASVISNWSESILTEPSSRNYALQPTWSDSAIELLGCLNLNCIPNNSVELT